MLKKFATTLAALGMSASFAWADVAANKQPVLDMTQNVFDARDAGAIDTYFTED